MSTELAGAKSVQHAAPRSSGTQGISTWRLASAPEGSVFVAARPTCAEHQLDCQSKATLGSDGELCAENGDA